jgi:hypothetical protein
MLDQFRDVMIIIMAFTAIGAAILFAALSFIIFRKISRTLDSVTALMKEVRSVSALVSNSMVRPTIKGASLAAGARKGLSVIASFARRKEEKSGKRE